VVPKFPSIREIRAIRGQQEKLKQRPMNPALDERSAAMPKTFLNLPHGLEVLIIKAAVDPAFKALLLAQRAEAAATIGLTLTPTEAAMLAAIPAATLEATIAQTQVLPETRRVFLGKAAAAMLAALGVTGGSAYKAWAMAPLGCSSDIPSPIVQDVATTQTQFVPLNERELKELNAFLKDAPLSHTANAATSQTLSHTQPAYPLSPWARFKPIFFYLGEAAIRADQQSRMSSNLEILKTYLKDDQWVLVIGHSDLSGAPEENRVIGARRAAIVRLALVRGGIYPGQIRTQAIPADRTDRKQPADPKQFEAEAARERRVDFLILGGGKNEQSAKTGNADSTESEMIDLHELVKFPKPRFSGGHSPYIPPDTLRDGWDVSPNSKRKD
jgi:outer membrane protein OmpA-like peptidoglycan-associated protein